MEPEWKRGVFGNCVVICTDYGVWGAEESHTHLGGSGYGGVAASRFDMGLGLSYNSLTALTLIQRLVSEADMLKLLKEMAMPYRVTVLSLEDDKRVTHKAWTQADAREWMSMYGRSYGPHIVRVTTRLGRLVASRATLA